MLNVKIMNELNCKICDCPKCDAADTDVLDFEYESPGRYTYYRCRNCGLFNIDPVPDEVTLSLAYPVTYHAYQPQATRLARLLKKRYWQAKAKRVKQYTREDSRVLDIGCSSGDFVVELKQLGVKHVSGIDFSAEAVRHARQAGVDAVQGDFDTHDFNGASFDVIVMTNFIEHVYDPVKTMRKCRSMLKPGGMVIGETPNTDAWDYKLGRRFWGGYHTPRHLYIFNEPSLRELARQTGFLFEGMNTMVQPAHWVLTVQNALQGSRWRMKLKNGRTWLFTPLIMLFAPVNIVQAKISRTSLVEFFYRKGTDNENS